MAKPAKQKLFVNFSASQARKRLKGHGLGVSKVETVGRNQAVIMHTASGAHLERLKALFCDLPASTSPETLDVPIENLRNLGLASAAWLREADIFTRADLERCGAVLAYRLVKQRVPHVSLNLLWALAAALDDKDWRELTEDEKTELRTELEE